MIPRLSTIVEKLLQQTVPVALVNVAVGELIVFSEDEIQSQWLQLVSSTKLSQTRLSVNRISAEQQCMVCFQKYHPMNKETSCPHCGSVGAKILAGEEFYLQSVEEENE